MKHPFPLNFSIGRLQSDNGSNDRLIADKPLFFMTAVFD